MKTDWCCLRIPIGFVILMIRLLLGFTPTPSVRVDLRRNPVAATIRVVRFPRDVSTFDSEYFQ